MSLHIILFQTKIATEMTNKNKKSFSFIKYIFILKWYIMCWLYNSRSNVNSFLCKSIIFSLSWDNEMEKSLKMSLWHENVFYFMRPFTSWKHINLLLLFRWINKFSYSYTAKYLYELLQLAFCCLAVVV